MIRWSTTNGSGSAPCRRMKARWGGLRDILSDPEFPRNNPNRLRALVGELCER